MSDLGIALSGVESSFLKMSYELGKKIEKNKENSLTSRIQALMIPIFCGVSETLKCLVDMDRLFTIGYRSAPYCYLREIIASID